MVNIDTIASRSYYSQKQESETQETSDPWDWETDYGKGEMNSSSPSGSSPSKAITPAEATRVINNVGSGSDRS